MTSDKTEKTRRLDATILVAPITPDSAGAIPAGRSSPPDSYQPRNSSFTAGMSMSPFSNVERRDLIVPTSSPTDAILHEIR
jgi:hypothetical protein